MYWMWWTKRRGHTANGSHSNTISTVHRVTQIKGCLNKYKIANGTRCMHAPTYIKANQLSRKHSYCVLSTSSKRGLKKFIQIKIQKILSCNLVYFFYYGIRMLATKKIQKNKWEEQSTLHVHIDVMLKKSGSVSVLLHPPKDQRRRMKLKNKRSQGLCASARVSQHYIEFRVVWSFSSRT